jgi:3-oxoadipate enol-lactonase
MPLVDANGLAIAYGSRGHGPPTILLHGATSVGRDDFGPQLARFAGSRRLLTPDARGHGGTRWDATGGFSYGALVDDLAGFLDALGLATVDLVGFSMGASTALGFASRAPDRVRSLVVVGTTTGREPRLSVARRLMDPDRIDRDEPDRAARLARRHDAGQGPDAWRHLLPAIVAAIERDPPMTPAELRRIACPTLVVVGDRDPFVPVDHAWGVMRLVRDGRLLVLPGCGHEALTLRPGLVNEALDAFWRSTDAVADVDTGRSRPR